jgi:hypothetical protein
MNDKRMLGLILVSLGLLVLLNRPLLLVIGPRLLWPLILIIPGLIFELAYFKTGQNPGLLVPGGVLLVIGSIFMTAGIAGYGIIAKIWPLFIMAPAVGLFQLYWFDEKEKALFWVAFGLGSLSLLFLTFTLLPLFVKFLIPGLLILAGFQMITGKGTSSFKRKDRDF